LPGANWLFALEHCFARPDFSHAEQAGSFPSHLIFAFLQRWQAATGLLTRNGGVSKGIRLVAPRRWC
jgi:hypothetical protein